MQQAESTLGGYRPTRLQRWRMGVTDWYGRTAARPWFDRALVAVFATLGVLGLIATGFTLADRAQLDLGTADWLHLISSVGSAVLIVVGLFALRHSRLQAYRWFARAVLVDLLLTEVFAFFVSPGWGVLVVFIDLLLLVSLRFAIAREQA